MATVADLLALKEAIESKVGKMEARMVVQEGKIQEETEKQEQLRRTLDGYHDGLKDELSDMRNALGMTQSEQGVLLTGLQEMYGRVK